MNRERARRYLRSRDFYSDTEGIDEFLEAWGRVRAEYPDVPEEKLLAGMDLDRNSQWAYYPEDVEGGIL
jgi:hypothetical protein